VLGEGEIDRRLYEVGIGVLVAGEARRLTAAESRIVIDTVPDIRAEAGKWRLKLGRPGRILLVDEELCAVVRALLAGPDGADRSADP
jgi:hypothetical protein